MTNPTKLLVATAAAGLVAAPAAAQTYQQQYPQQPYQQQPYQQQPYQQQPYQQQPYQQQYGQQTYPGYGSDQDTGENVVGQIIDQLLGNRYSVTDRQAVSRCASAALIQARQQYRGYGQQGYGYRQGYGYQQGPRLRVTSITDVQRRSDGLRVRGTIGPAYGGYGNGAYGQYGNQYGNQYRNYGYAQFNFRCNVDYRGSVTGLRVTPVDRYRRY